MSYYPYAVELPWSSSPEESRRLKNIGMVVFGLLFLFGVIMPWLPTPEIERKALETLPPQLAKIVLEKPKPKPIPEPKPIKEEPKVEEKPKEKPKEKEPPKPKPEQTVEQAKKKAESSGLLQFKDDLADLREQVDLNDLKVDSSLSRNNGEAAKVERNLIAAQSSTRSGGVDVSKTSRNTGGGALSGRETTKVESPIAKDIAKKKAAPRGALASRSEEEIRRVFDANKGSIYAAYNRELRKDPALQGKLVLELVIEPSGKVSAVKVLSSELNNPALERKIRIIVSGFKFPKASVSTTKITYPIILLPS